MSNRLSRFKESVLKWLEKPGRFEVLAPLAPWLKNEGIRLLYVGCGNHSATIAKRYYPLIKYYGIDRTVFENDENDFARMEKYWELDLDAEGALEPVPNDFFDVIVFCHVIEHTRNGLKILGELCRKLKPGGMIYVETPSPRSVKFPSMKGTLNFYDDPTHIRPYPRQEIERCLQAQGLEVLVSKDRRMLKRILLTPVYALGSLIRSGELRAVVVWELFGFPQITVGLKKRAGASGR